MGLQILSQLDCKLPEKINPHNESRETDYIYIQECHKYTKTQMKEWINETML